MTWRHFEDGLELEACLLETPEPLLENGGTAETDRTKLVALLGGRGRAPGLASEPSCALREMIAEIVVTAPRDEERLDGDVRFAVAGRPREHLAPRRLRSGQRAPRALGTSET